MEAGKSSRVAVVTGGASGIGLGATQQLAADGHRVALLDLNGAVAEEQAAQLPGAIGVAVDVANHASVDAAFARVRGELGRVGILVTSAASNCSRRWSTSPPSAGTASSR